MPKFQVKLIKEVWEKAYVEVDAADEDAAEDAAIALANVEAEKVEWSWEEDRTVEAVRVDEIEDQSV